MECLKCKKETGNVRRLLEVQTLHIRDLNGERMVQALGSFLEAGVCEDCVDAAIREAENPDKRLHCLAARCACLFLGGLLLLLIWKELPLRIAGAAAMVCGASVWYGAYQRATEERRLVRGKTKAELRQIYTLKLLQKSLPQKSLDSDLTYMDISADFLQTPPLVIANQYGVLPKIARKALLLAAEQSV